MVNRGVSLLSTLPMLSGGGRLSFPLGGGGMVRGGAVVWVGFPIIWVPSVFMGVEGGTPPGVSTLVFSAFPIS